MNLEETNDKNILHYSEKTVFGPTPISGNTGPSFATISMSKTDIENLVAKLNNAKTQMESIWNDIKNNDFQRITNSWAGKDCQAYMSKVNYLKLTGTFEALGLLANTYKKALDEIEELQAENISIIQSM